MPAARARRDDERRVVGQPPLRPHLGPVVGRRPDRAPQRAASAVRCRRGRATARALGARQVAGARARCALQLRADRRLAVGNSSMSYSVTVVGGGVVQAGDETRVCRESSMPRAAGPVAPSDRSAAAASARAFTSPVCPPQAPQSRPAACGLLALWLPWPASSTSRAKSCVRPIARSTPAARSHSRASSPAPPASASSSAGRRRPALRRGQPGLLRRDRFGSAAETLRSSSLPK